jgi:hypothetical protein
MEQINNGLDGLGILGCHQAMVVNLTVNLPIPLGKSAYKFGGILTARLIYINLLVSTTQAKNGKIVIEYPI